MAETIDRGAVIGLLQDDLKGEHAALVQYLQHAYKMGEKMPDLGEMACEVEEIAREEMRHYDWLSEKIVDLGGVPTIDRDPIYINGSRPSGLMQLDLEAENRAINQYEAHLAAIADPQILGLLRRILSDELAHREKFIGYIEDTGGVPQPDKTTSEGEGGPYAMDTSGPAMELELQGIRDQGGGEATPALEQETVRLLNEDIASHYALVLQYLQHSYLIPDCSVSRELLEDRAQWEMKHMGWLAEQVVELGGEPSTEHGDVAIPPSTEDKIKADILFERQTTERLQREIEAISDPDVRKLLQRIKNHKAYDEAELTELLNSLSSARGTPGVEGGKAPGESADQGGSRPNRLTIGSLIDPLRDEPQA